MRALLKTTSRACYRNRVRGNVCPRVFVVLALAIGSLMLIYNLTTHPFATTGKDLSASLNGGSMVGSMAGSAAVAATPDSQEVAVGKALPVSSSVNDVNPFEFLDLIPVGKSAPALSFIDAAGAKMTLSQFKGKQNLVLIFYQGSFCSVCGHQLQDIQAHLAEFKKLNTEIIAFSADDLSHAKTTVGEHGVTFHIVPDPERKAIKTFGVSNVSRNDIAYPSVYIIDKTGKIRLSFADAKGKRLHSEDLLPKLSQLK